MDIKSENAQILAVIRLFFLWTTGNFKLDGKQHRKGRTTLKSKSIYHEMSLWSPNSTRLGITLQNYRASKIILSGDNNAAEKHILSSFLHRTWTCGEWLVWKPRPIYHTNSCSLNLRRNINKRLWDVPDWVRDVLDWFRGESWSFVVSLCVWTWLPVHVWSSSSRFSSVQYKIKSWNLKNSMLYFWYCFQN